MRLTRRRFLRAGAAATAAALTPVTIDAILARAAGAANRRARGYGPLASDKGGLLDLPEGFQYRAFSTAIVGTDRDKRFSQRLDDGTPVPARHDGMGAFAGQDGITILVRNHELEPDHTPAVGAPDRRYDPLGTGGTTTLWVDADRRLVRSFTSLSGTFRNCGGGVTPWGSWITAEECTYMPGPRNPVVHDLRDDVAKPHGYLFEVSASATEPVEATPLRAMGRFYHEAIAVDPRTGVVYLTEDRADGLLYRFRPALVVSGAKRPEELATGDLAQGGVLEALRLRDIPQARTQNWDPKIPTPFAPGRSHPVDWVAIPQVEPAVDMERDQDDSGREPLRRRPRTAPGSIRAQGYALGAAQFARVEGICHSQSAIYFCSTDGGRGKLGQVWKLDLRTDRLTLVTEPDDAAFLDGPDNLVVAPNRDIIVCEDGDADQFVVGITPQGTIYRLARNAFNDTEFAGACFSPDGQTMFVNIQNPGITFAVWGPWESRRA